MPFERDEFEGFVGQAYEAPDRFQDSQICVNYYPEISQDKHSKTVIALLGAPGKLRIASIFDAIPLRIISPETLPSATQGSAYRYVMVADGGSPPYRWTLASVIIPSSDMELVTEGGLVITTESGLALTTEGGVITDSGLSLSKTGVLTGVPVVNGPLTLQITVLDSLGHVASGPFSLFIQSAAATVPAAPTIGTALAGNSQATVSWTLNSSGGSPITLVSIFCSNGTFRNTISTAGPFVYTGLTNGTIYTFTVTATNAVGQSTQSANSNQVTPFAPAMVPSAPSGVVATAGNTSAALTWVAPASNGGSVITGYTVTSTPATTTQSFTGTSGTFVGLANGTSYVFNVSAVNAVGTGPASASSNSITPSAPATVPGIPTSVVATAGNAQVALTWTVPSNGGSAITGYSVVSVPATTTQTFGTNSGTFTGLSNGTAYTFKVSATNAIGTGSQSAASNSVTPATVPGAPTGVAASAGNTTASISWTAPPNGGSAISQYTVTSTPGSFTRNFTGTSGNTFTGLTNGTAYTFKVTATNAIGTGPASAASNSVTPSTGASSLVVVTQSLPASTQDMGYFAVIQTIGAQPGATLTYTDGGISGNYKVSPSGYITGYRALSGSDSVTGTVTDGTNTTSFAFNVATIAFGSGALAVDTSLFPTTATQNGLFYGRVGATGGKPPYFISATYSGANTTAFQMGGGAYALPSAYGVMSGVPTATGATTVTFTVTDVTGATANTTATITTNATLAFAGVAGTTQTLPSGMVNNKYRTQVWAQGGTAPYSFSATIGNGYTMASTGIITGTPTGTSPQTFTVTVTDAASATATQQFTIATLANQNVTRPSYNTGSGFFVLNGLLYDSNGAPFRIRGVNSNQNGASNTYISTYSAANTVRNFVQTDGGQTAAAQNTISVNNVNSDLFPIWSCDYTGLGTAGGFTSGDNNIPSFGNIVHWLDSNKATLQSTLNGSGGINPANEWSSTSNDSARWQNVYAAQVGNVTSVSGGTITISNSGAISANAVSVGYMYLMGVPGIANQLVAITGGSGATFTTSATSLTSSGAGGTLNAGVIGCIRGSGYTCPLFIDPYQYGQGFESDLTNGIAAARVIANSDPIKSTIIAPHIYGGITIAAGKITAISNSQVSYTQATAFNATGGTSPPLNQVPGYIQGSTTAPQFNGQVSNNTGGSGGTAPNFIMPMTLTGSGTGTDGYVYGTTDIRYQTMMYGAEQARGICYIVEEFDGRSPPTANDPSPGNQTVGLVVGSCESAGIGHTIWSWDSGLGGSNNSNITDLAMAGFNSGGAGKGYFATVANLTYQGQDYLRNPIYGLTTIATPASAFL